MRHLADNLCDAIRMALKKDKCPECDGTGWYNYHWVECGNSQIDEWIKESCKRCEQTGFITYEKPVKKKSKVKNGIAKDLRTSKYKMQVKPNKKLSKTKKAMLKEIVKYFEDILNCEEI